MQAVDEFTLFFLSIGAVIAVLAVYFMVALVVRLRKGGPRTERGEVGFMAATFHDLVARLKDKERELEELRRRAEEKAGIIEDYNENILRSVPSGVISLDEAGRVVKVNPSAERILGMEAGRIEGKEGGLVLAGFTLEPPASGQRWFVPMGGGRRWVAYVVTPLLNSAGGNIGRLIVLTDLTELKALEEQAERRNRLLSLGEMAAGMAHELRNPMGVIAGYMRMLSKRADRESLNAVEAASREVAVMDRIINDFLSFANPPGPNLAEVDLGRLLGECAEGLRGRASGVRLKIGVPAGVSLAADEVLLRQAFANLLGNALDAVGGRGEVSVEARAIEGRVEVDFLDSGHGIPEGLREKIFLPFYSTKERGTGLGLAVAHGIIVSHGGSVELVSTGEAGSLFRVTLPARPSANA